MSLSFFICIWTIVAITYGNTQESSDCLGSLRWSTTATTVMDGSGSDPLGLPLGLFIEPKTQILYVADGPKNRVQKMYPNGQVLTAAGQANGAGGSTAETLWNPINIVADEKENLYVADWNNQRIQLWEKNAKKGTTVAGNGTRGSALNEFSYPSSIALDSKGNLHVADTQNQRITQWSLAGNSKESIGTITAGGNGAGLNTYQLNNPMDFFYDEANQIYYITNEDSHSITQWLIGDYEPRNIYAGIPGRFGNTSAQLTYPHGITLDRYGNLYVADVSNSRIQVFCPDTVFGITIAGTGVVGKGSDQLSYPTAVALDAQMNLYVSDTFNNRVQKFQRIQ